ncbi:conserved hypothetical protein [Nocardia seriolae]|nr:conserved hypothetical protein [Nocardia seriolae]
MDTGPAPEQFGVVLMLDHADSIDLDRTRQLIAERIDSVPRLRQRLIRTPLGCGAPIWVDDPRFDLRNHVRTMQCPVPGDEQAMLDLALSVIMNPLPKTAPLWAAVLITGLTDRQRALVVVLHHVLADGIGGLAVLTDLIDTRPRPARHDFPRPEPTAPALARDALIVRWRSLRGATRSLRLLRASLHAAGGLRPSRVVPGSLTQRTGPRLRLALVRADVTALRTCAHRYDATTNDAVLVAVAAALHHVLRNHGESVDPIVATVPVSGRPHDTTPGVGNMVAPMLISIPTDGAVAQRLRNVADQVHTLRDAATGPPPIATLGWLFRPMAALGVFRWYMNHQHRFHTLISHVRGPSQQMSFGGSTITSAIPIGVGPGGNTPVYFEVLSYADTLTVTIAADPDHFPYLAELADAVRTEFDRMLGDHPRPQPLT